MSCSRNAHAPPPPSPPPSPLQARDVVDCRRKRHKTISPAIPTSGQTRCPQRGGHRSARAATTSSDAHFESMTGSYVGISRTWCHRGDDLRTPSGTQQRHVPTSASLSSATSGAAAVAHARAWAPRPRRTAQAGSADARGRPARWCKPTSSVFSTPTLARRRVVARPREGVVETHGCVSRGGSPTWSGRRPLSQPLACLRSSWRCASLSRRSLQPAYPRAPL